MSGKRRRGHGRKNIAQRPVIGPGGYGPGVEGYKTWQDTPPSAPAHRARDARGFATNLSEDVLSRLQAQSPGLAGRLADGLTQEQLKRDAGAITKALEDAGAVPGTYMFDRGKPESGTKIIISGKPEPGKIPAAFRRRQPSTPPDIKVTELGEYARPDESRGQDLPYGLQAGDLTATEQPLGQLSAQVRTMLDSGMSSEDVAAAIVQSGQSHGLSLDLEELAGQMREQRIEDFQSTMTRALDEAARKRQHALTADPAPPLRTQWPPEDVLNRHARLAKRYADRDRYSVSYLAHLMNAAWEGDPEQAARMHWPVPDGERGVPEGQQMARLVARQLRDALTYQVTAPMVSDMRRSEELLPGVQYLSEGDLPAPAGFAWLDNPWMMPLVDGILPVRAVSWEKTTAPIVHEIPVDCARMVFWVHLPDVIATGLFAADDPQVADLKNELGDLLPHHISLLPFGFRFSIKNTDHTDESRSMVALIHSLWTFLGMELSASRTFRPPSHAHRRIIRRALRHDQVHVVTLRRISYISDGNGRSTGRIVNRTCKWWVGDFCRHIDPYRDEDENGRPRRHQAVPAERTALAGDGNQHDVCAVCLARGQTVRVTLVHGHRRGPAHLPWKTPAPGRTVYRLAR